MQIKPFILSFIAMLLGTTVMAQDCFSGWSFYRPLTLENTSSDLLTDIQARVSVDVGTLIALGKLKPDLSDLRIVDTACNPVHFYIDPNASDSIRPIWIRVDSLAGNGMLPLEMYYGNSGAQSAINGDSTFIFFDDFASGMVDSSKWEAIGEYDQLNVSNGALEYSSTGSSTGSRFKFIRTAMHFSEKVHFDFKAEISNSNGFGFSSADTTLQRILFRISGAFGFDTLNQVAYNADTISNGIATTLTYPFIHYPRGEARDATMTAGIDSNRLEVSYFANLNDSSATDNLFRSQFYDMSGFHFILSSFSGFAVISLNYLHVRKFLPDSLMPSSLIGDEQMLVPSAVEEKAFAFPLSLSPNPVGKQLQVAGLPRGLVKMEWLNSQGQIVASRTIRALDGEALRVVTPDLTPGLYWVRFQNEQGLLYAQPLLRR